MSERLVSIPSYEEQKRIVSKIEELLKSVNNLSVKLMI